MTRIQNSTIIIAAGLFIGFGLGVLFSPSSAATASKIKQENNVTKLKLTIMQDRIITLDVPIKLNNNGVGIKFNTPLTNITDIGLSLIKE